MVSDAFSKIDRTKVAGRYQVRYDWRQLAQWFFLWGCKKPAFSPISVIPPPYQSLYFCSAYNSNAMQRIWLYTFVLCTLAGCKKNSEPEQPVELLTRGNGCWQHLVTTTMLPAGLNLTRIWPMPVILIISPGITLMVPASSWKMRCYALQILCIIFNGSSMTCRTRWSLTTNGWTSTGLQPMNCTWRTKVLISPRRFIPCTPKWSKHCTTVPLFSS